MTSQQRIWPARPGSGANRSPQGDARREFVPHVYAGLIPTGEAITVACRRCKRLLSAEEVMASCPGEPEKPAC